MIASPTTTNPIAAKQKLAAMVKDLLNRPTATGGDVAQIVDINVWSNADIVGRAVSKDKKKTTSFTINIPRNLFEYKLINQRRDSDDDLDNWEEREDAKRKAYTCKKGVKCKGSCIQQGDTCRNSATAIASKSELSKLQATAVAVNPAAKDAFENKTIRELQKEARERGVYRANHQSKDELINTLRVLESNPKSQETLRKTLEGRRTKRKAAEKLLPKDAVNIWKTLSKIGAAGKKSSSPDTAALLVAGVLVGASGATMQRMRDRYKSGLNESAQSAMERAQKIPVVKTNKPNVTFAVGGFAATGSTGQRLKDLLEAPQDGTKGEKWFGRDNEIIPFNSPEFNINTPGASKRKPDGNYNPVYLGSVAKQGFGQFVQNFGRKRNEASVDLAANLYATAIANPTAQINALAHGVGGNVMDEATEILARMRSPDKKRGLSGADVAKKLNIVRLGSPHFGFTNDKGWSNGAIKHRTITSSGDPFSILPKRAAQWISTVRGAEPDDYLKNMEVRDRIREAFGYYSNSLLGREAAEKRRKETRKTIGEAISVVSPSAGKLWNQLGVVSDKARENPAAASILGGAVLLSTSAATYQTMRKQYQAGLTDSAAKAVELAKAERQKVKRVGNSNITFAVGGAGSPSQDLIDALPVNIKGNPTPTGNFTGGQTHVVGFDDEIARSAKLPDNPESLKYNTELLRQGYGGVLTRALKGVRPPIVGKTKVQNEDAIALASQIYANAQYQFSPQGRNRKDYKINVLAAGTGGVTAREALEIVAKMPNGDKISKQVSLVTLGTPSFGLVNNDPGSRDKPKYVPPEVNFMGEDPITSRLPGRGNGMSRQVPVKGASAKSYLGSTEVMQGINQTFYSPKAKPKPTPEQVAKRQKDEAAALRLQKQEDDKAEKARLAQEAAQEKQQQTAAKQLEKQTAEAATKRKRQRERAAKFTPPPVNPNDKSDPRVSRQNFNIDNPEDLKALANWMKWRSSKSVAELEEIKKRAKAQERKSKPRKDADDAIASSQSIAVNPKQRFATYIKNMIESVFTDGIRSVPNFDVSEDGTMTGQFIEDTPRGQLYDFVVTTLGKIKYNEANAIRKDSANFPYWTFKTDAAKKPSCQKGKRCGDGCVEQGLECDRDLPPEMKAQLPKVQKAAKVAKLGKWAAAAAILAGGAIAATNLAKSASPELASTSLPETNKRARLGAIGTTAAVVTAGGAIVAKKRSIAKEQENILKERNKRVDEIKNSVDIDDDNVKKHLAQKTEEIENALVQEHGKELVDQANQNLQKLFENSNVYSRVYSLDVLESITEDRFKNAVELGDRKGSYGYVHEEYLKPRLKTESDLFGMGTDYDATNRPISTYIANSHDAPETGSAIGYGDIAIKMKPEAKKKVAMTGDDSISKASYGSAATPLAKPSVASFMNGKDYKAKEMLERIANAKDLQELTQKEGSSYVEGLALGQLKNSDIEEIVIPSAQKDKVSDKIKSWAKKNNVNIKYE